MHMHMHIHMLMHIYTYMYTLQVLWTKHLSSDFALFVALAIIDMQKPSLHKPNFDFSDIIQVSV